MSSNEQIITDIAIQLFGEDEVDKMLEEEGEIGLHTADYWRRKGFLVKKGEHGYETRLWKKRKRKDKKDEAADDTDNDEVINRDFFLAKSFLFTSSQVVMMKK